MATHTKRCSYVSESESSSCEDGRIELRNDYKKYNKFNQNSDYGYRKTKCSTKNAIMARENRIKKKLYMQKLEHELNMSRRDNIKLKGTVEDQSCKIVELQKHIKYLKSALSNSADLRVLMNNIKCSTGMSVATSLDKTLTQNNHISKNENRKTLHPWNEHISLQVATVENEPSINLHEMDLFNNHPFPDLLDLETLDDEKEAYNPNSEGTYKEHNYTLTSKYLLNESDDTLDDVGVCLHVSKHRVSLEFCPTCSENATETWNTAE